MNVQASAKTVVVSGDFTLDWNLARGLGLAASNRAWEATECAKLRWQRGGAGLLADLICGVANQISTPAVHQILQPKTPKRTGGPEDSQIGPEDTRFHHSFATWMPYDLEAKGSDAAKGKNKEKAWRVAEFQGVNQCAVRAAAEDWEKVLNDDPGAELVVIDDASLGFRRQRDLWPASLTNPGRSPWVLVKMSRPVAKGDLWDHLCLNHAKKLIVVMTVNDLRLTKVQISHPLSWERTAQDLVWELSYNSDLRSLKTCAHVVISFNAAGAFHFSRGAEGKSEYRLLFDPEVVEDTWEKAYEGRMVGYSSCLIAGIAKEVMVVPDAPNIPKGVCAGLWSLRSLHREGYGQRSKSAAEVTLKFPIDTVVAALAASEARFGSKDSPYEEASVPMRMSEKYWTILEDQCAGNLEALATSVVLEGPKKQLKALPLGHFGGLLTVDRHEIESLRSIGSLVSEYVSQPRPKKPLSIAVFGPPGSGKSFGIQQLALSLRPGEIEIREFNLSQFRSFGDLLSAFHQVRDIALGGKIPLVFWDEFDTSFEGNYGWLRHFLAPMQDGTFQQGDLSHPIGKAIFVFAGGTSSTFDGFGKNGDEPVLRAAKVPDFISRLKGYLNVLGPNPRADTDLSDPYYVLRRGILLRAMIERSANHLVKGNFLDIDEGVLRALLLTRTYKHGARSMESVLAMSQLEGKTRFERSSLPTKAQLDLHVDGKNFMALVHRPNFDDETLERMARVAHKIFCEQLQADGWEYSSVRNNEAKEHPYLVDFDELPEEEKEQNVGQVRDIPGKLAQAGCSVVPIVEGEKPFVFPPSMLEELASREHTRWMSQKAADGWRFAGKTEATKKLHQSMLPWQHGKIDDYVDFATCLGEAELPEAEKEKDRTAVRGIARILNECGFTIV